MKVYDIAMARSGDKTDTSNIAVWPYDDANWEYLKEKLTIDYKSHWGLEIDCIMKPTFETT